MKKNWVTFSIAFTGALLIRLIPFRAPNLEPVLATQMPFSKVYGAFPAFIFGLLSIVIYDALTAGFGVWTLVTGLAYGFVGVGASYFFKKRSGRLSYALYAMISTIIYDAVTGLTMGPLFFGQSFASAAIGQIPFTFLHLLGNVAFAIVLSPVIESWAMKTETVRAPVRVAVSR